MRPHGAIRGRLTRYSGKKVPAYALSARSDGADADPRTEEDQLSARSDGTYADPRTEEDQSSPGARHDRSAAACRDGWGAGLSPGRVSGPRRSSVPQMTAPAAKMPAHHQNTVV